MRILPFWLLLFACLVPSSFAAEVASSDSIRQLRTILSLKGVYDGRLDGLNGPKTERAILLYERNTGQPLTGQPSLQLLETLGEEVREGSNADSQVRDKVDALGQALTDSERERASLSRAVVRIGKDLQAKQSSRERELESIVIGSTLLKDLTTITLSMIALALTAGFVATYIRTTYRASISVT